jgi:hypothetical protein
MIGGGVVVRPHREPVEDRGRVGQRSRLPAAGEPVRAFDASKGTLSRAAVKSRSMRTTYLPASSTMNRQSLASSPDASRGGRGMGPDRDVPAAKRSAGRRGDQPAGR